MKEQEKYVNNSNNLISHKNDAIGELLKKLEMHQNELKEHMVKISLLSIEI